MRNLLKTAMIFAFGIASSASSETLSLDQAVSIALGNNPTVLSSQLEIEKGETRVTAARTKRLPSLTLETYGSEWPGASEKHAEVEGAGIVPQPATAS